MKNKLLIGSSFVLAITGLALFQNFWVFKQVGNWTKVYDFKAGVNGGGNALGSTPFSQDCEYRILHHRKSTGGINNTTLPRTISYLYPLRAIKTLGNSSTVGTVSLTFSAQDFSGIFKVTIGGYGYNPAPSDVAHFSLSSSNSPSSNMPGNPSVAILSNGTGTGMGAGAGMVMMGTLQLQDPGNTVYAALEQRCHEYRWEDDIGPASANSLPNRTQSQ